MTVKRYDELLAATRMLYGAMYRFDAFAAARLGIHTTDLRCINALEGGPLSPGKIGTQLALTSGSVTSMLKRLEDKGFVVRVSDAEDQRRVIVQLDPSFFAAADQIFTRLGAAIAQQFETELDDVLALATTATSSLAVGFDRATE